MAGSKNSRNGTMRTSKKLIRDFYQDKIPPEEWYRATPSEYKRRLGQKLREEVKELADSGFKSTEEYADVLEVLKSLAFVHNIDWNDVEQARFDKQIKFGKFMDGIVLLINKSRGNKK